MSTTFQQLLQQELRGEIKKNSQKAQLLTAIKQKKGLLDYTVSVRTEESMSEDTLDAIEKSADERINTIINDMLDGTLKDGKNSSTAQVGKISGLRTKRGTIISALNLRNLLQISLQEHISTVMGTEGHLNYRTGRLANSATITGLEEKDGQPSVFFSYMLYPYATYEPGNAREHIGRPPSELIDTAIDIALGQILHKDSVKKLSIIFKA